MDKKELLKERDSTTSKETKIYIWFIEVYR